LRVYDYLGDDIDDEDHKDKRLVAPDSAYRAPPAAKAEFDDHDQQHAPMVGLNPRYFMSVRTHQGVPSFVFQGITDPKCTNRPGGGSRRTDRRYNQI
jgi:hypothetical protein